MPQLSVLDYFTSMFKARELGEFSLGVGSKTPCKWIESDQVPLHIRDDVLDGNRQLHFVSGDSLELLESSVPIPERFDEIEGDGEAQQYIRSYNIMSEILRKLGQHLKIESDSFYIPTSTERTIGIGLRLSLVRGALRCLVTVLSADPKTITQENIALNNSFGFQINGGNILNLNIPTSQSTPLKEVLGNT